MRWSRLSPCLLAAVLCAVPPAAVGATAQEETGPQEAGEAPEASAEPEEQPEGDPAARAARKAERQAKRQAAEAAEPDSDARTEAADSDVDSEADSDSDSDARRPVLLVITSDEEGTVFVDGTPEGRVEPDEPLELRVDLGEVEIKVMASGVRGALWEKTLELEEPGTTTLRVRLKRAIRLFQREERKSGVFRDPKTHLMWPMRDNGLDVDLRQAYSYCRDLGTGGFEDWRLPTLAELKSLEAIWHRGNYKILGDILLTECCTWSSEYDGTERAWTFNYRFRKAFQTNAGYTIGLRALCVREWDPEAEPERPAEEDEAGDRG